MTGYDLRDEFGPNLVREYPTDDIPALATLRGQQVKGDWGLKVADVTKRDIGTLRSWSLKIEPDI